jgi:hypothetical protein
MDISYCKFELKPKYELNHRSGKRPREGVFLRSKISYWEYFPHPEFGDESVESFLDSFVYQKSECARKGLTTLVTPLPEVFPENIFFNHYLFGGDLEHHYPVIKYKLKSADDRIFLNLKCERLRLDANGLFSEKEWASFKMSLPDELIMRLEYVEDPMNHLDWSHSSVNCARDFISGFPYSVRIYKPYREFYPEDDQVIFSGNMGHALSQYLSYLELIERGDLSLIHGLINPSLYEEVPGIFKGDYQNGFSLNQKIIQDYLLSLHSLAWRSLCKI